MTKPTGNESSENRVDLLVVGSGIAGLVTALTAAEHGADVMVVSKGTLSSSASYHAQGGIAAACGEDDSPELHAADTIIAGRGLCRPSAVEALVEEAPARIDDLRAWGVRFGAEPGLEGGHSRAHFGQLAGPESVAAIQDDDFAIDDGTERLKGGGQLALRVHDPEEALLQRPGRQRDR